MRYNEAIDDLVTNENLSIDDAKRFLDIIIDYLDARGYFEGDYNIHGFPKDKDWLPYRNKGLGQWLLDMAMQWNIEHGKEYLIKLVEN